MNAQPIIKAADADTIAQAAGVLRHGGLVAFPTETVYGLGGDATSDAAVAAIFAAKQRPSFNPLIIHVADIAAAERVASFDARARRVADRFWPGALTLVLPRRADSPVSLLAGAGLDTLAVRMPDHPVASALLRQAGLPIAAPSANRSGAVSPTTAQHVAQSLGHRIEMILDGGACRVGIESTVLDLSDTRPALLRPGGVTREDLEAELGPLAAFSHGEGLKSPGQMESHYAPLLPLRLDAAAARPGELLIGFGTAPDAVLNLSASGDVTEAAANLFAMLRSADRQGFEGIAVMPIPEAGLGVAINDRLRRAAAPRPLPGPAPHAK